MVWFKFMTVFGYYDIIIISRIVNYYLTKLLILLPRIYYSRATQYRPSVDRLPRIPLLIFKSRICFFLLTYVIWLPLPPFSNICRRFFASPESDGIGGVDCIIWSYLFNELFISYNSARLDHVLENLYYDWLTRSCDTSSVILLDMRGDEKIGKTACNLYIKVWVVQLLYLFKRVKWLP